MAGTVTVYIGESYSSDGFPIRTEDQMEDVFNDMLEECYGMVNVLGMEFLPGPALKALDPIAYRQNFLDWLDSDETTVEAEMPWELFVDVDDDAQQEWAAAQL